MNYEFPVIEHIDDVLPAIEGSPEFVVAERGTHKVINYHVAFADTFPEVADINSAIRRECRGLIFGPDGEIIRRPYSKFFNIGEKEETQPNAINLSETHHVLEKLDGSMISPFYSNGNLIFGTKMGDTEVSQPVNKFVLENSSYIHMAENLISQGYSPIFEWCSRKQRIVLDYEEDQLILTAIRHMKTGKYLPYSDLEFHGDEFNIPVVKTFDSYSNINELLSYVKGMEGEEGFVIRFGDGHMVKAKSDWYVQIHRAKDLLTFDRNIVKMILDNNLDDLKSHLPQEDVSRLDEFERHISKCLGDWSKFLFESVKCYKEELKLDRKTFAIEYADKHDPFWKPLMFSLWDNNSIERAYESLIKAIDKNLGSNVNYEPIKNKVFGGISFNA